MESTTNHQRDPDSVQKLLAIFLLLTVDLKFSSTTADVTNTGTEVCQSGLR